MQRNSLFASTKAHGTKLAEGTAIGLAGRYLTWPIEKMVFDASITPNPHYPTIIRANLNTEALKELHSIFKKAGVVQTVGKAASSMGVATVVDHEYSHLSPIKKGLLTAVVGFGPEALTTASGESRRVQFSQNMVNRNLPVQQIGYFTPEFQRVLAVTSARALWTSVTTFTAINMTDAMVRPYVPSEHQNSAFIKAGAALVSTFCIQPFNMPIINFQTYVLRNPKRTMEECARSFYRENTCLDLVRGAWARSVHRGVFYFATFFMSESLKKLKQPKEENADKKSITRKMS